MPWHTQAHDDAVDTLGIFEFQLISERMMFFDVFLLMIRIRLESSIHRAFLSRKPPAPAQWVLYKHTRCRLQQNKKKFSIMPLATSTLFLYRKVTTGTYLSRLKHKQRHQFV